MLDNLTGELRVFTKKYEAKNGKYATADKVLYNTCYGSTKNDDGTYTNVYAPVNFSKEVEKDIPEDVEYFDIILKKGWFKAYKDRDGHTQPILFVNVAKVIK